MAKDKDDEDKPLRSNAAPVLKPPGMSLGGAAPPGTIGTEKSGMAGPFYMLWGDERNYPAGDPSNKSERQDSATPRFHETDDPDINRLYGQDHVMVRADGSEMYPDEWKKEGKELEAEGPSLDQEQDPENDPDKNGGPEKPELHAQDKGDEKPNELEVKPETHEPSRSQLWEDMYRKDDDGIDR